MRHILSVLCLLYVALPAYAQAERACDGFTARLSVGAVGQVTAGAANNVREAPTAEAELVGQIPGEGEFTVLDGPVCAEDLTWWQVETPDGSLTGWTVAGTADEYWVEPKPWLGITPEQVAFDYHPVANAVMVEVVPASQNSPAFFGSGPDYISIRFEEQIVNEYITPRLTVIPVGFFEEADNTLYNALNRYHQSLYEGEPTPDNIVTLPYINAARVHFSHAEYIELDDVRGYRFVTMFAQYPAPVRGREMIYMFIGMTPDGEHLVSAWLPLTAPAQDGYFEELLAANDDFSTDVGVKDEYREMLSNYAAELPGESFYPTLATLDAVVRSIEIGDDVAMPAPLEARPYERVTLPEIENVSLAFGGEEEPVGVYTLYYEVYTDSDVPYLLLHGMIERDLYRNDQVYAAWRRFEALLDEGGSPAEMSRDPSGFVMLETVVGEVQHMETETLRGVRFLTAGGEGAMVGTPLTYHYWGLTPNNTLIMVESIFDIGALPETAGPSEILSAVDRARLDAALSERDAIVENLTFEIR